MRQNFNFCFKPILCLLLLFQTNFIKAQCCEYTLFMLDGYGDSWNGGNVEVFINDQSIGRFFAKDFGSYDKITVCDNDKIELIYSSGEYEEENHYQLLDEGWNVIFHDEINPVTGSVYTNTLLCGGAIVPGSHPCHAITVDTLDCISYDNTNAKSSFVFPYCAKYSGNDVWFTLPVPKSGNLKIEAGNGTLKEIGLSVWTADGCANMRHQTCNAGSDFFAKSEVFNLQENVNLLIQVFGYDGSTGNFELCVTDLGEIKLTESEIPIVLINTHGQSIPHDTKINGKMDIKYNGPGTTTKITDPSNIYRGNIGIEVRGASSAWYPQTPYGFETRSENGENNNVSLLHMPTENDWVLLSNFNDRSLMRNALAFNLFEKMGNYSVRSSLCEVLIDSSYKGIYLLAEKIKRDKNRVNIATLTNEEISGDDLTGGYILQQNHWNNENSFQSNYSPIDHPGLDIHFLYEYPEPGEILQEQKTYIASFIDSLESALYSNDFADEISGYRKYLDVKSFIDYFLINELARNGDGFKKSVFFNKDKNSNGGKLKAGPVWDFDWAWKNMWGCYIYESKVGAGWAHLNNDCNTDNYSCGWYVRMLQDTSFANELRCTYDNYRATLLDTSYIFSYMDSLKSIVHQAQQRHFKKWPILGISGPAPELGPIAITYEAEIDTLKQWIVTRLAWLDHNIPGSCKLSNEISPDISNNIKIYPNPANQFLNIKWTTELVKPSSLKIINGLGQEVYFLTSDQFSETQQSLQMDIRSLPSGIYFLLVKYQQHQVVHKIDIQR